MIFFAKSYLVPSAAKRLVIPCSVDLIINISRGFSQAIRKCENTKILTFFVEDIIKKPHQKTFFEKIFSSFLKSFKKNSFKHCNELWLSVGNLSEINDKSRKIYPPIKLQDYRIFPEGMFERDYFLINSSPLSLEKVSEIILSLEVNKYKFRFIGKDNHLGEIKLKYPNLFLGEKCTGEMAPLLSGCRYLVDLEKEQFPSYSLKAMSCGRPVFSLGNDFLEFGEGYYRVENDLYHKKELDVPSFDPKKVRGRALKFEELKFKHLLQDFLKEERERL